MRAFRHFGLRAKKYPWRIVKQEALQGVTKDCALALKEYKRSIEAGQELYKFIHFFEVVLRNAIHIEVGRIVKNENWLSQLIIKDSKLKLVLLNSGGKETTVAVNQTCKDLHEQFDKLNRKKNGRVVEGDLVASQSLGFWIRFTGAPFDQALTHKGLLTNIFGKSKSTKQLRTELNKIRQFRNRVFHCEPLRNQKEMKELIEEYLRLLSPEVWDYFFSNESNI